MSYNWRDPSPLELAQGNYSDLYKDVYGFRPALPRSLHECDAGIASLRAELARREASFPGRMSMRLEGWSLPHESDPVLAKYSQWIEAEHEREMADWYRYPANEGPAPLPYDEYEAYS